MDLTKAHLVDMICRIAPYQREKSEILLANLKGDKLNNYLLRGVMKSSGSDYSVHEYLKDIFEWIIKRVRDIPPFKRRVIEFKEILNGK